MDIPALLERGFRLKTHDCFPAAPSFLRGVDGVPSGSAFPPLWSRRFFASRIYGRGGLDGSHPTSGAEKRRFDIMVPAELVMCITSGVAAERKANQRTQILPVELINLILRYNRGDEVPTHRGTLSVRATGEWLMRARSVDAGRHETEWPLHVSSLLYYVPDAVLDAAVPATAAASPYVALPSSAALRLPIPPRLFAPWKSTVEGVLRLFVVVFYPLSRYDRSLLLEVPLTPFLGFLSSLMLPSAFRPQLGFLHLLCLPEGRRVLRRPGGRRPGGRRPRFLTSSPPIWTWRNSGVHILICATFLTGSVTSVRRGCAGRWTVFPAGSALSIRVP